MAPRAIWFLAEPCLPSVGPWIRLLLWTAVLTHARTRGWELSDCEIGSSKYDSKFNHYDCCMSRNINISITKRYYEFICFPDPPSIVCVFRCLRLHLLLSSGYFWLRSNEKLWRHRNARSSGWIDRKICQRRNRIYEKSNGVRKSLFANDVLGTHAYLSGTKWEIFRAHAPWSIWWLRRGTWLGNRSDSASAWRHRRAK